MLDDQELRRPNEPDEGLMLRHDASVEGQRNPEHSRSKSTATPDAVDAPASRSRPGALKTGVAIAALLLAISGGTYYGHYWWTAGRYLVSTDDAYVGAKSATLSPKVSGYIKSIAIADNTQVSEGDVIARIDDGDYRLAVQTARDQVGMQDATVERLQRQTVAAEAAVDQADAQLASAKAGATRAKLELARQQDLASRQVSSRQSLEQAQANDEQAAAAVRAANAAIEVAKANVEVLKAQQLEAERALQQNRTALAKAERDLSFTVIRAPYEGVIGNRAVQVGDYVQPTQRLASLVPLDAIYVDANFKETQLAKVHPGQPVTISVDAFPDRKIEGRVQSIAPASGSVFSLLPPDNATGNFTKIVQRLPVRVAVPAALADQSLLRPGMSVVVSVNTKPGAPVSDQKLTSGHVQPAVRQQQAEMN